MGTSSAPPRRRVLELAREARGPGAAHPHPPRRITVEEATAPARGRRDGSATRKTGVDDFPAWARAVLLTAALTHTQKVILLNIGTFDWVGIGEGCTAGTARLIQQTRCNGNVFRRTVRELVALGLLHSTRRPGRPLVLRVIRGACLALEPIPVKVRKARKPQPTQVGVPQPTQVALPQPTQVDEAFRSSIPPAGKPSEDVVVAGRGVVQDWPAPSDAGRAPHSGPPVPAGPDLEDLEQRAAIDPDPQTREAVAKYLARRRGTATALPVGASAGPAPVAIASPATSSSAPDTAPPPAPIARLIRHSEKRPDAGRTAPESGLRAVEVPPRFVAAHFPTLLLGGISYAPGAEVPAELCRPALVAVGHVVREDFPHAVHARESGRRGGFSDATHARESGQFSDATEKSAAEPGVLVAVA